MRYLSVLLLVGCVRSELPPTQSVDCEGGVRAVVDYTLYCVMEPGGFCPEAVPVEYRVAGRIVCAAYEELPEAAVLAAVRQAEDDEQDGGEEVDARRRSRDVGAFDE